MRVFISPVGTSILTNYVRNNEISFSVYDYANYKKEDYAQDELNRLIDIVNSLKQNATEWSIEEAKTASAELNGLLSFDKDLKSEDLLYFIITDTLQSRLAFEIVNVFLQQHFGITGQEITLKHLTTKNKHDFLEGVKELLRWSNENLSAFKNSNYSIYFNLTGGFKSLLGYLTPIGMFYADSIFYIFETGELIEIPKLPIKVDETLFSEYAAEFLLMNESYFIDEKRLINIPQTLLEEAGEGKFGLSVWGELMWDRIKENILTKMLIPLPGIKYSQTFKNNFKDKNTDIQKIQLQETLAKVGRLLLENGNDSSALKRDNGLSYENCRVKKHESKTIGHFRYNQSQRVSCVVTDNGLLLLENGYHDVCD